MPSTPAPKIQTRVRQAARYRYSKFREFPMSHVAMLNFSFGDDIDLLRDTVNQFAYE
jgi:hypothetical protein